MKFFCCSVLLLLTSASTLAADSETVKMRISMLSESREEAHWDIDAELGKSGSIADQQFKNYDQVCSPDGVSQVPLKIGNIGTGLAATVTPTMKTGEGFLVQLSFNYRYIKSMSPFTPRTGCTVNLPRIHDQTTTGGYVLLLKPGEKTEILPGSGDKYRFMIEII